MHKPSFLPGKPSEETPGKGRNRSWQPSSLEIPSAVPAERHITRTRRAPEIQFNGQRHVAAFFKNDFI